MNKPNWPSKDEVEHFRWTNNHSNYHSFGYGFAKHKIVATYATTEYVRYVKLELGLSKSEIESYENIME